MHCPSIYLSGAADELMYRREVKRDLGEYFVLFDPIDYSPRDKYNFPEIVERDKELIRKSDILLAYIEKPSFGTIMEIMYAWFREIPVYVVTSKPSIKNDIWLSEHTNKFFDSLTDAKIYLTKQL